MIEPRAEVLRTPLAIHGGRHARSDVDVLDFSVCLNAFGPAAEVRNAIANAAVDEYPDPASRAVRAAAAAAWTCSIDEIMFSAGSTELIHAVCQAYVRKGDAVIVQRPAFGEYARAASLNGATVTSAPMDGIIDVINSLHPRIVFAASPANPTGQLADLAMLTGIADACAARSALLVLDQAYDAFTERPRGTPALHAHPAVLHLRSITKEHALAGVRAAFGVAPVSVVTALERVRVPWAASSLAQAAGIASLSEGAARHVRVSVAALRQEAARLQRAFSDIGFNVRRSDTHFFLAECGDARRVQESLLARGVLVRDCTSFEAPDCIRVAARTPSDNDVLIEAVRSLQH